MAKKKVTSKKKIAKKVLVSPKPTRSSRILSKPSKTHSRKVTAEIVEDALDKTTDLDSRSVKPSDDNYSAGSIVQVDDLREDVETKAIAISDPVTQYLNEIRKYPLLTKEQELELAKKYYETKDPIAAQALVTANLRFVVKVAAEYSRFGARMIDLVQEGNMGLMHAVRDFNPYKGVRLITYAVWWIRGYIQEYLMKQYSMVKIGTTHNQKKLFYQLQKQKRELDALGEKPDIKLIASKLNIPEDEVIEMSQRMSGRDVSLDQPLSDDSGVSLKDLQKGSYDGPDEEISRHEEIELLKEKIEKIRPSLNEKEKIILEERLLADEPLTLQEIGEKYKITREAVRQAEARLMKKIKEQYK